jgi:hypothetical protein
LKEVNEKMKITKNGNKVTLEFELEEKGHPSASGKTTVLYSSKGFLWQEGLGVNLTVCKSKK